MLMLDFVRRSVLSESKRVGSPKMDDEDIYERFEISDYDIANEFNVKRGRRPTKEQQIYGIWADEDEEEEEEEERLGKKNKKDKKEPKVINFVTSKSAPSKSVEKDEEEDERPSFSSAAPQWKRPSDDIEQFSGFRDERSKLRAFDSKFCEFEKNTRGIGSKLLLKMGYEPGKGLGKNLQGIVNPIQAKPRQGKGAIAYYGSESANGEKAKPKEPEKSVKLGEKKPVSDRYFDKPKAEKRKVNYVYVDEELVPKADSSAFNKLKIIDMTGPEERVFEGYQQIHKTFKANDNLASNLASKPAAAFDDSSDSDDQQASDVKRRRNQLDYERHRLEQLANERVIIEEDIRRNEEKKRAYELLIEKVNALNSSINKLEPVLAICEQVNDVELAREVFYSFGFTALNHDLRNWLPFDDPNEHLDDFRRLHKLFGKKRQFYDQILWHCWVPYVRMSIETFEDMRKEDEKMIRFFDEWDTLVSRWIVEILINQTVVAKLRQQVTDWNPTKDRIPIQRWVHPWLPKIRAQELETIFEQIRGKFANTLKLWKPLEDPYNSAKIVLEPWKPVFGAKSWSEFMRQNIIPKLEQVMAEFVINPRDQKDLRPLQQLYEWKELISEKEVILILKKHFFPKWLKVLFHWLNGEPNYREVEVWYKGWKTQFPEDWFNRELVVCQGFTFALKMIEFCIDTDGKMASFEFV